MRDGRAIATLTEARVVILDLPDSIQERAHWLLATELLLKAADSGSDNDIGRATLQIERALIADGRRKRE